MTDRYGGGMRDMGSSNEVGAGVKRSCENGKTSFVNWTCRLVYTLPDIQPRQR